MSGRCYVRKDEIKSYLICSGGLSVGCKHNVAVGNGDDERKKEI